MSGDRWGEVDRFFETTMLGEDPVLNAVLENCRKAELPPIHISPCQGQLLRILARMTRAKRILELGTLGGYSTIWLARSLPEDGHVMTLECNEAHVLVAEENLRLAGVGSRVTLIHGDAGIVMKQWVHEGMEPFDLVFIDADKPGYPNYLARSLQLSHPGAVIIADNVVREGAVAETETPDPVVQGVQGYCRQLMPSGLLSTGIQTVGRKGYDGFAISIVP